MRTYTDPKDDVRKVLKRFPDFGAEIREAVRTDNLYYWSGSGCFWGRVGARIVGAKNQCGAYGEARRAFGLFYAGDADTDLPHSGIERVLGIEDGPQAVLDIVEEVERELGLRTSKKRSRLLARALEIGRIYKRRALEAEAENARLIAQIAHANNIETILHDVEERRFARRGGDGGPTSTSTG